MVTREEWYRLPRELRLLWWRETRFDRLPPSPELMAAVKEALALEAEQNRR